MIIKIKAKDNKVFIDKEIKNVVPTIRSMSEGDVILFPYDYREAVRTACSILRTKENIIVHSKVWYHNYEKYMKVTKEKIQSLPNE